VKWRDNMQTNTMPFPFPSPYIYIEHILIRLFPATLLGVIFAVCGSQIGQNIALFY
jgi:hypothetical protein